MEKNYSAAGELPLSLVSFHFIFGQSVEVTFISFFSLALCSFADLALPINMMMTMIMIKGCARVA